MSYWPGTNIPKSQGNAFDWRSIPCQVDWRIFPNQHQRASTDFVPFGAVVSVTSPVPPEDNLRRLKK